MVKSVEKNKTIDFLLFTDDHYNFQYPDNVKVVFCTFDDIKRRTKKLFDFNIILDRPYKFCDYRPAFGYIFANEIKNYDFWGTCDLDIIFGDIRKFMTDDILNHNDKILTRDHFVLYKNNPEINERFKSSIKRINSVYKKVFSSKKIYCFGERSKYGMYELYKERNWPMYDEPIIADIYVKKYNFIVNSDTEYKDRIQVFVWPGDGKLYRCY